MARNRSGDARLWAAFGVRLRAACGCLWGPPSWPATFSRHDGSPGGRSDYCMTGPDGERSCGYWQWVAVDEGRSFEVRDGFTGDDGEPNTEMPDMRMVFEFTEAAVGSRLTCTTTFNSREELEQLRAMGMVEGTKAAMGQIDEALEDWVPEG